MTPYSSTENHSREREQMASISDIKFIDAAAEFVTGYDVEALVAVTRGPRYEFQDTDEQKGSPDYFNLDPHEPDAGCKCYFCQKYYSPSLADFAEISRKHDPNEWCYCLACEMFRGEETRKQREKDEEKKHAEQTEIWRARITMLTAEADAAKAEEESALLRLMDFKPEEEGGDIMKPKKSRTIGDWVKRHLRSPCPFE